MNLNRTLQRVFIVFALAAVLLIGFSVVSSPLSRIAGPPSFSHSGPVPRFPSLNTPQRPVIVLSLARENFTEAEQKAYADLASTPDRAFVSEFPSDEVIAVTSGKHPKSRKVHVQSILPCYGRNSTVNDYDLVLLPIGCFGDQLEDCTSCRLSVPLTHATSCSARTYGTFLGDNFYPHGLRNYHDQRLEKHLHEKFFKYPQLQVPFYATAGNHDRDPRYLFRKHPYWRMDATYYSTGLLNSSRSDGATVEVFLYSTHPFQSNDKDMAKQAAWLDEALQASTARWKIVATHEPIFGYCGPLHHNHNSSLAHIHPILLKHNIRLLMASHLHGVFLHRVEGGYYQLVSAGFASNLQESVHPRRPLGFNHLGIGATAVLVRRDYLDVVAFDDDDNVIFTHRIPYEKNPVVHTTALCHTTPNYDPFKYHTKEEAFFPLHVVANKVIHER